MWGERSTEVASSGSQQRGRCQNTPWSDLVFVSQRCCPRQQSPCFLSVLLVGPLQAGHVRRRADRNVEALATGLTEHRAAVEPLGLARLPAEIAPVADLPRNPDTVVADRTSGARRVAERARGGAARRPPRCSSGDGWCRRSAPSHASLPSVSPRCARVGGVSVHANVPACDRRWLERLCRFRGALAPAARLRAQVVPEAPDLDAAGSYPGCNGASPRPSCRAIGFLPRPASQSLRTSLISSNPTSRYPKPPSRPGHTGKPGRVTQRSGSREKGGESF